MDWRMHGMHYGLITNTNVFGLIRNQTQNQNGRWLCMLSLLIPEDSLQELTIVEDISGC